MVENSSFVHYSVIKRNKSYYMLQLSIIIPVYNAEKFLPDCLNSVLSQHFEDFEIICINDGSIDNSLEILNDFAKSNANIIVLSQENQGVSAARNAGLAVAKGKYIGFVDADDTIDKNYFPNFLKRADTDIISSSLMENYALLQLNKIYNKTEIQNVIFPVMLSSDVLNSACTKIFKNDIIQKYGIRFPIGMKLGEDAHFIMGFLSHAESFRLIENKGYHYRENPLSASRSVKDDTFFVRAFQEFEFDHQNKFSLELLESQIEQLKSKRLIHSFVANLSLFFRKNDYLSKNQRHQIIKENMQRLFETGILQKYGSEIKKEKGKFEQFVIDALIQQSFTKIKWAYKYSHWRNKIK